MATTRTANMILSGGDSSSSTSSIPSTFASAIIAAATGTTSTFIHSTDENIANAISATDNDVWVLIVDVVILVFTIVGSLGILVSMLVLEWRGRAMTTRMRIVQSLVVSDLMLGIIGMIGSIMELAGHALIDDSTSCDGLGFSLVATLFSQHFWTLSLAFATFMILVHPLNKLTLLLEKHWYYLWLFVWVVSCAIALVGYEVYGYFPSGGICFYGSNAGLYGELIQFIPRGIVFIFIASIYGKLFVFLRRPDKIRTNFSDTCPTDSRGDIQSSFFSRQHGRVRGLFSKGGTQSAPLPQMKMDATPLNESDPVILQTPPTDKQVMLSEKETEIGGKSSKSVLSLPNPRTWSRQSQREKDVPPWERVELSVFQVDGQRFGGAQANTTSFGSSHNGGGSFNAWADWKGFGAPGKKRPSTTTSNLSGGRPSSSGSSEMSSPPQPFGGLNRSSSGYHPQLSTVRSTPDRDLIAPVSLSMPISTAMGNATLPDLTSPDIPSSRNPAVNHARRRSGNLSGSISSSCGTRESDLLSRTPPVLVGGMGLVIPSAMSTPTAETPHFEGSFDPEIRRNSGRSVSTHDSFASTTKPALGRLTPVLSSGAVIDSGDDVERDAGVDDDEPEVWDLMKVLRSTAPPETENDRFAVASGSDQFEYVPESMASYLNRKTALLMLWFPLGYVLLFSVSLIRLIYDFSGNPPASLRAISRWMIFAQGALDALIYGFVEWHTKRVVRKRVRKGTFSPRGSGGGGGSGLGSAIRGLASYGRSGDGADGGRGRTSRNGASITSGVITSQVGSQVGQTVSFAEPIDQDMRSIHQQLVDSRHRGSTAATLASGAVAGRKDSLTVPPR